MAIEPLIAGMTAGTSLVSAASEVTAGETTVALAPDVDRFQRALNASYAGDAASTTPQLQAVPLVSGEAGAAVSQPVATTQTPPPTLGAAILASLQSASADVSNTWQHAARTLASPELTIGQALEMQMLLLKTTIEFDLSGKLITKAAQNLEQIVKTQ